jgi:hypothetical protein
MFASKAHEGSATIARTDIALCGEAHAAFGTIRVLRFVAFRARIFATVAFAACHRCGDVLAALLGRTCHGGNYLP